MRQFHAMFWTALVVQVLMPAAPRAQVPDHLKCYKVKESAKRAIYTADLGGLAPEQGCLVKLPGKLLCVETTKTNVSPPPPGAPAGPAAGQFVCYKVKCPKGAPPVVSVTDQFGTHTFTSSAAQLLCAPAQVASPTTTTTTNPGGTTTTTTTVWSTTSTTAPSVLCCEIKQYSGFLIREFCAWAPDDASCQSVGGTLGAPGSLCDASTGHCTATGGLGGCCDGDSVSVMEGCISGPFVNSSFCSGPGVQFHENSTCVPNGTGGVCQ